MATHPPNASSPAHPIFAFTNSENSVFLPIMEKRLPIDLISNNLGKDTKSLIL